MLLSLFCCYDCVWYCDVAGKTKNMIGISETLLSTCVAGIVFGLLAGQPLIIIGTTGPLLMFDESLFKVRIFYW